MGWGGGGMIFDEMVDALDHLYIDELEKRDVVITLINALENEDWDGLGDMDIDDLPRFAKRAVYKVHPDWAE